MEEKGQFATRSAPERVLSPPKPVCRLHEFPDPPVVALCVRRHDGHGRRVLHAGQSEVQVLSRLRDRSTQSTLSGCYS